MLIWFRNTGMTNQTLKKFCSSNLWFFTIFVNSFASKIRGHGKITWTTGFITSLKTKLHLHIRSTVRTQILFYLLGTVPKPLIEWQNLLCTPYWYGLKPFYMCTGFFLDLMEIVIFLANKIVKVTSSRNFVSLCLNSLNRKPFIII